jgi:diaminopimelate decarboxylase
MGKTSTDAVAEIAARLPRKKPQSWEHRVDPQHKATLDQIKAAYRAGRFGSKQKPAAVTISAWLRDQGIATVGFQGVLEWLAK